MELYVEWVVNGASMRLRAGQAAVAEGARAATAVDRRGADTTLGQGAPWNLLPWVLPAEPMAEKWGGGYCGYAACKLQYRD